MASEVLSVAHSVVTDSEVVLINGVNGHTYTVLFIQDDGGSDDFEILSDQAIGANETYEHTGRIVLTNEDHLTAKCASAAAVDVVVSYLDQTR
jgi:hypothetical protein